MLSKSLFFSQKPVPSLKEMQQAASVFKASLYDDRKSISVHSVKFRILAIASVEVPNIALPLQMVGFKKTEEQYDPNDRVYYVPPEQRKWPPQLSYSSLSYIVMRDDNYQQLLRLAAWQITYFPRAETAPDPITACVTQVTPLS